MNLTKILIALDSSTGTTTLMKIAAELAHKADAELLALYVEDIEWFEASKHSFTQQISSYTGEIIPFSEQHITIQSKALKRLLQTTLTDIGRLMNIRYSYHEVRGVVNKEQLDAAARVDLVVVRRAEHPVRHPYKLSRSARELAEQSPVPVLVWNAGSNWPQSFIGICSTPDRSSPVIDWTVSLADIMNRRAYLFWPAELDLNLDDMKSNTPLSVSFETVKKISERHHDLSPEELKYYRNELLIISRDNLTQNPGEYLEALTNSVLLL
ncbi:universal stress protein [Halalkalibaculum sp. DA384]|uniref:universal stress protein n=1 Tax=Halalkalibaculum sp. DA384 TaxID=3373606 RepID=UPI0037549B58